MRTTFVALVALAGVTLAAWAAVPPGPPPAVTAASEQSCGLQPLKPLTPLGCKDLVAECVCERGRNGQTVCRWIWRCVPSE